MAKAHLTVRGPRVGDRIVVRSGARRVTVTVVEDRGNIGVGGRRLLRVRRGRVGSPLASVYEIPADEIAAPAIRAS